MIRSESSNPQSLASIPVINCMWGDGEHEKSCKVPCERVICPEAMYFLEVPWMMPMKPLAKLTSAPEALMIVNQAWVLPVLQANWARR